MQVLLHPMVLTISLPIFAGILCMLLPRKLGKASGVVAIAGTAITLFVALKVFLHLRASAPGTTIPFAACPLLHLRLDNLSAFVLVAVAAFGVLSALYSLGYMAGRERLGEYYAYLLWTVGLSCGAVLANHLILLLIFWGMLGGTLYMMIGIGGADASAAAKKTFIIIGGSDCMLMLGIAIVWVRTGSLHMGEIRLATTSSLNFVAFLCFVVAAFAKAGAMPVHSWVPDCGEKAPLSVSAFLPASLDKLLGIYLLARAANGMFEDTESTRTLLMLLGSATVMCAVMMALVQHDLKRLLAYHAVSQVGYMVLGIGSGTAIGIAGGLFHMLNHAMYKSCLFMCAGSVETKAGTTDLDKLGGLAKAMPFTFASCFLAAMAISGVPPLNGFASKWMVYQGIIQGGEDCGPWALWLVAAMFGSALTLASFVKVLHAVFLRKPATDTVDREVTEVGAPMRIPTLVLATLCVLFGVLWFRVPVKLLIGPAVGEYMEFSGYWWGGGATLLLLVAVGLGGIIYFITTARKPRRCETYIGGELLREADIPSEAVAGRDVEVTGVDFYRSVETLEPFQDFYQSARKKMFDVYDVGTGILFYFVELLRGAHTGRLPAYLTWLLAGLLLVVLWLMRTGGGIT